jgi:HlyD family secretion protein
MKKLILALVLLWGGGALGVWYWNDARHQKVEFRTVRVARGDLLATINATGTLEPEDVVDVGAQVAGEVRSFGPDPRDPAKPISYGTPVAQGTVLARLDDALFKARLAQAQAGVAKAEADVEQARAKLRQAERDRKRNEQMNRKGSGFVSAQESDAALANFETARAGLGVAESAVGVARANLDEANVNLRYTTISSPVKGVILDRRVNIGQTVVASLNAPSLFLIAKDLGRMEIWASVNENDIGVIKVGQAVRFTVGAFPNETFPGTVTQIRLNASMAQGVVTYTVVVGVDNPKGRLLPYLTARLQFEVEEGRGVLLVPNAALRWRPPLAYIVADARDEFAHPTRQPVSSRSGGPRGTLWVRQGEMLRPVTIGIGLTDGVSTEVRGDAIKEGMQVVVGIARREAEEEGATPFLPQLKNDKVKK